MVNKRDFGRTKEGVPVTDYVISNGALCVTVMDLGVTLRKIEFAGKDVLCGYNSVIDYEENDGYVGATIGRYGNRIGGGTFTLNDTEYRLSQNEEDRQNTLHGGEIGFDKYVWQAAISGENAVTFSHVSPAGDQGFPGELQASVTVSVTEDNAVKLEYHAVSNADTVYNPTNHAYFNLHGYEGGDTLDTLLTIKADAITPVNENLIPTGEILNVEGTPFDFRTAKTIGRDQSLPHPQLAAAGGFDHNFVLNDHAADEAVVIAQSEKTGITMECFTTEPGVQLYTGIFLNADSGKNGIPLYPHQGFCLETQHYPDSPNRSEFPSVTLKANTPFTSTTVYRFSK